MSNSPDTFGGLLMEVFNNAFGKTLQQDNVKEFGFRTANVLITRHGSLEAGIENIEIHCDLIDGPLKLSINTKDLEAYSKPISTDNLQTYEEKTLFFNVVENTGITLSWLTAQEALKTGYEITRVSWREQKVFFTIYNYVVGENQKYLDLRLYYQDKKDLSTGWIPSVEDKEANDWIIKRKS